MTTDLLYVSAKIQAKLLPDGTLVSVSDASEKTGTTVQFDDGMRPTILAIISKFNCF